MPAPLPCSASAWKSMLLLCWSAAITAGVFASETVGPEPPEMRQLLADLAAVPDPFDGANAREIVDVWGRKQVATLKACSMGTNIWPAVGSLVSIAGSSSIQVSVAAATILATVKTEQHPQWDKIQDQLRATPNAAAGFEYLVRGRDEGLRPYSATRREFAIRALGIIRPAGESAARTLVGVLESKDESDVSLWRDAAASLGKTGTEAGKYLPMLHSRFASADEELKIRTAAADSLAAANARDEETMSLLRRGLADPSSHVRLAAARALLQLGEPFAEVRAVLASLLEHKLPSLRADALRALSETGSKTAPLRPNIQRLRDDPSAIVREAANALLRTIPE